MKPSHIKRPGDPGAAARRFRTEEEAAEATECPEAWQNARDGTACIGPGCPYWQWHRIRLTEHQTLQSADATCNGKPIGRVQPDRENPPCA
jgi:hypothetical protein